MIPMQAANLVIKYVITDPDVRVGPKGRAGFADCFRPRTTQIMPSLGLFGGKRAGQLPCRDLRFSAAGAKYHKIRIRDALWPWTLTGVARTRTVTVPYEAASEGGR